MSEEEKLTARERRKLLREFDQLGRDAVRSTEHNVSVIPWPSRRALSRRISDSNATLGLYQLSLIHI